MHVFRLHIEVTSEHTDQNLKLGLARPLGLFHQTQIIAHDFACGGMRPLAIISLTEASKRSPKV